mgnify:FL=1
MRLTLKERQSLTRVIAGRYKRARKKEKGGILDEFLHKKHERGQTFKIHFTKYEIDDILRHQPKNLKLVTCCNY